MATPSSSPVPPLPPPGMEPKRRGRPPGRKNNQTLLKEAAMRAAMDAITPSGPASDSALTLLQSLYRDPNVPLEIRMKAASLAAPLETARPVPIPPPKDDSPLAQRLADAMRRTGKLPPIPEPSEADKAAEEAELARMLGLSP